MFETRIVLFAFLVVAALMTGASKACADDPPESSTLVVRSGQHITLTTDAFGANKADDLIASFDTATRQWAAFWQLPDDALRHWKVQAHVIRDKSRFYREGMIPPAVPDFPYGYALNNQIWVMAQQSDYYTRHLLLHEGVHALAYDQFGGAGPSWFMEGSAEMLAVHSGSGNETKINQIPANRESVPYWGRFRKISEQRTEKSIPSLNKVIDYPRDLQSDVAAYSWSWAAVMLLNEYPEYRDSFFASARNGSDSDAVFNAQLKQTLRSQWPVVDARWRLMCHSLDYGYDWDRERVELAMSDQEWNGQPISFKVAADRGWQSIGVRLTAGTKLKLTPGGRCTLANEPKPWVSEPAGVTIRYVRGRPLGQLLACIVSNAPDNAATLKPLPVAAITRPMQIPIKQNCWMLFRVNDAVGELDDNQGGYAVKIQRVD